MSLLGMNAGPKPELPTRIKVPREGSVSVTLAANGVIVKVYQGGNVWDEKTYIYKSVNDFRLE